MGKQILLLGLGQMGCAVADLFARKMGKEGQAVHALAIDTDERTLEEISDAAVLYLCPAAGVNKKRCRRAAAR
jgi:Trk K+ transport system NAD-binding subunit